MRIKQICALMLACMLLFAAGCGEKEAELPPQVQDPQAFLDGFAPYQSNDIGSSGAKEVKFLLNDECGAVCTQYVNALLQNKGFELISLSEDGADSRYFFGYSGAAEVAMLSPADKSFPAFHVFVEVLSAESIPALQLRVVHAPGLEFADLGARADLSGLSLEPQQKQEQASTQPSTKPADKPATTQPSTKPADKPATTQPSKPVTPQPSTKPAASVSASATYLPDIKLFLDRTPSKDEKYDGGWRQSFREVPDAKMDTVIDELIELLENDRYQLKLSDSSEKTVSATNYYHYYFTYTGSGSVDTLTDDDGNRFNVHLFVTHYTKKDYFHINFHYSSQFDTEDPGSRVSADVSGGSSSGSGSDGSGTADGYDPYTPDASKLPCLTCDGDGDCNSCGGKGYKMKDGIKSDCTSCSNGNCPSCGGSGTR